LETYQLFDIQPAAEYLLTDYEDIRMAASPGLETLVIYAPYSNDVEVKWDGTDYDFVMVDLENRNVMKPQVDLAGRKSD
jgi:hypothetical protein